MFIYIYEKKVQTLMVNDFNNINKMKNHFSSQILEQKIKPRHMKLEIQVLAWDKNVGELNLLMGS